MDSKSLIMKYIHLFLIILFCSCNNENKTTTAEITQAERDSFTMKNYGKKSEEVVKDMVKESLKKGLMDTAGLYKAPVRVLSSKLVTKEYSDYRDISLTFKNISGKTIEGIKFKWYGETAFKEPADMGGVIDGFGSGFTDKTMRPNKSLTMTWGISSGNAKKVILAWPFEVVFSDGSKWILN